KSHALRVSKTYLYIYTNFLKKIQSFLWVAKASLQSFFNKFQEWETSLQKRKVKRKIHQNNEFKPRHSKNKNFGRIYLLKQIFVTQLQILRDRFIKVQKPEERDQSFADLLIEFSHSFKLYVTYISQYNQCLARIQKKQKKRIKNLMKK